MSAKPCTHIDTTERGFHPKLRLFLWCSALGAALKSRYSTLPFSRFRHFSSTLLLPSSFIFLPRNTRLPLPTPASLTSLTVPLGKVASLARHVKSFSPHLSLVQPPSAIPPREQSQEKLTKCRSPPPPSFHSHRLVKAQEGKGE